MSLWGRFNVGRRPSLSILCGFSFRDVVVFACHLGDYQSYQSGRRQSNLFLGKPQLRSPWSQTCVFFIAGRITVHRLTHRLSDAAQPRQPGSANAVLYRQPGRRSSACLCGSDTFAATRYEPAHQICAPRGSQSVYLIFCMTRLRQAKIIGGASPLSIRRRKTKHTNKWWVGKEESDKMCITRKNSSKWRERKRGFSRENKLRSLPPYSDISMAHANASVRWTPPAGPTGGHQRDQGNSARRSCLALFEDSDDG